MPKDLQDAVLACMIKPRTKTMKRTKKMADRLELPQSFQSSHVPDFCSIRNNVSYIAMDKSQILQFK